MRRVSECSVVKLQIADVKVFFLDFRTPNVRLKSSSKS